MKRILLVAAWAVMALTTHAQSVATPAQSLQKQKNPYAAQWQQTNAPRRALAENQYLCGYYNTDDLAEYGSGMGYTSGTCVVATPFTKSVFTSFVGFKVVGVRIGLCEDVDDFSLKIYTVSGSQRKEFITKELRTGSKGWNTVMLDEKEQFVLGENDSYLVGYGYRQVAGTSDAAYPISYYEGSANKGIFYFYGNIPAIYGGSGLGWYNLGADGALSVQLIVEGELPDQHIVLGSFGTDKAFYPRGGEMTTQLAVSNMGNTAIESLGFDIFVDGTKVDNTTVTTAIAPTQEADVPISFTLSDELTLDSHTVKVALTTVNGAEPTGDVEGGDKEATFMVYIDSKERQKHLVEHFTSWTCTYCPLGYNILRKLESNFDDVAWVSIHGNQNSQADPLNFTQCNQIQKMMKMSGWPSASFDRLYDSYWADGDVTLAYGLGYNASYAVQIANEFHQFMEESSAPAFVTLDIEQSYDNETRQLDLTVKGTGATEASTLLNGYGITIYVTEAGLTGRQLNQGTWVNGYSHDNALRMVLTAVGGDAINWNGDNFEYTTSVTIPETYVAENLSITALVAPRVTNVNSSDIYNMAVNNCEKVALNTASDGIEGITDDAATATVVERYSIDGRRITAPSHGIVLLKMSDGTVKKVAR